MNKYIAIATASIIGLAGTAVAADTASPYPPQASEYSKRQQTKHRKENIPRDLQNLDLSSKQKAEIQSIIEAARSRPETMQAMQAQRAERHAKLLKQMEARRTAEQNLITAKKFDEAAARRLIADHQAENEQRAAERKQYMADMELKRLKMRHDIFQVLTPKQQRQWLENRKNRMEQPAKHNNRPQPQATRQ